MFKKTGIINYHLFQFRVGLASNLVLDVVNVGTSGARKSKTICSLLNAKDVRTGRTEHQHLSIIFSVKKSSFVSLPFHVSNYNQIKHFHQKKFSYIIFFRMGTCFFQIYGLHLSLVYIIICVGKKTLENLMCCIDVYDL
jgi:hypothetical protein